MTSFCGRTTAFGEETFQCERILNHGGSHLGSGIYMKGTQQLKWDDPETPAREDTTVDEPVVLTYATVNEFITRMIHGPDLWSGASALHSLVSRAGTAGFNIIIRPQKAATSCASKAEIDDRVYFCQALENHKGEHVSTYVPLSGANPLRVTWSSNVKDQMERSSDISSEELSYKELCLKNVEDLVSMFTLDAYDETAHVVRDELKALIHAVAKNPRPFEITLRKKVRCGDNATIGGYFYRCRKEAGHGLSHLAPEWGGSGKDVLWSILPKR